MTAQELYDEYEEWMRSVLYTLDIEDQSLLVSTSLRLERMMYAEAFLEESIHNEQKHFDSLKNIIPMRRIK